MSSCTSRARARRTSAATYVQLLRATHGSFRGYVRTSAFVRRFSDWRYSEEGLGTDILKSLKAPIAPLGRVLKFPVVLVSNILCLILFGCHKARCAGIFYLFEG